VLVVDPSLIVRVGDVDELLQGGRVRGRGVQRDETAPQVTRLDLTVFGFIQVRKQCKGLDDFGFLVGRDVVLFREFRATLCGGFGRRRGRRGGFAFGRLSGISMRLKSADNMTLTIVDALGCCSGVDSRGEGDRDVKLCLPFRA
jgi:hypothetical protein